MSRGIVRLKDKTTHGGEVISATSRMVFDGLPVALVGDKVSCPIPGHGVNQIIEGSASFMSDGRAVAVNGCRCVCGCQLISSLPQTLIV